MDGGKRMIAVMKQSDASGSWGPTAQHIHPPATNYSILQKPFSSPLPPSLNSMAVTTHPPTFHSSFDFPVDDDATSASDKPSSMSSSPPFSPAPSSSCTSLELDGRSVSPAPSVYSMTSSIREQSYRVEYGRGLNNYSEVYRLPADPEELERLGTLHRATLRVNSSLRYRETASHVCGNHGQVCATIVGGHGRRRHRRPKSVSRPRLWERRLVRLASSPRIGHALMSLVDCDAFRIMDVARDFPNSQCVAVDLVPMQSLLVPNG